MRTSRRWIARAAHLPLDLGRGRGLTGPGGWDNPRMESMRREPAPVVAIAIAVAVSLVAGLGSIVLLRSTSFGNRARLAVLGRTGIARAEAFEFMRWAERKSTPHAGEKLTLPGMGGATRDRTRKVLADDGLGSRGDGGLSQRPGMVGRWENARWRRSIFLGPELRIWR